VELHLDESRPETPSIDAAISRREGVLLSLVAHVLLLLAILFVPDIPFVKQMLEARAEEERRQAELLQAQQPKDNPTFVYVAPMEELKALKPPPRAEMSDIDRVARARERAPNPRNELPFSLGKSPDRVESQKQTEKARGEGPSPEATMARNSAAQPQVQQPQQQSPPPPLPDANTGTPYTQKPTPPSPRPAPSGGSLGEALRNLRQYTDDQTFSNPDGNSGQFGPSIQFDTKGVEFGPWIRRFIAQVKRNWFIPMAAMSLKGHVVLQFNVHKDGTISDLAVVQPSPIDAFNNAAVNAIRGSNPTQPLPPEYPTDKVLFTVTFYYNESPAQ
jgi:TonB family protein